MTVSFRPGDVVLHKPSGEHWVVAAVSTDQEPQHRRLLCCGWPESQALFSECELVEAASDEKARKTTLAALAGSDARAAWAEDRIRAWHADERRRVAGEWLTRENLRAANLAMCQERDPWPVEGSGVDMAMRLTVQAARLVDLATWRAWSSQEGLNEAAKLLLAADLVAIRVGAGLPSPLCVAACDPDDDEAVASLPRALLTRAGELWLQAVEDGVIGDRVLSLFDAAWRLARSKWANVGEQVVWVYDGLALEHAPHLRLTRRYEEHGA